MKALSICQPYPHLILTGEKRVENRTWRTDYRGPLLLHAGKSREWLQGYPAQGLVFGAVVGIVDLVDCLHIDRIDSGDCDDAYPWIQDHAHVSGPWCWIVERPRRLRHPLPWRGQLGLFELPACALVDVMDVDHA
jgi:activating signal cointegrator 1